MGTYVTVQSDMWDAIALRTLGDEHFMSQVMEANYEYHKVRIFSGGITLNIPEVAVKRRIPLVPWRDALQLPS